MNRSQTIAESTDVVERVVDIKRVAKVVKGGRRFSLSALVVVGDRKGRLGLGKGKAKEANEAIRKATEAAKKGLVSVSLFKGTLPHEVLCKYGATKIIIKPASPGTGLIAGGAARTVLEVAGVQNVLTKITGSRNSYNVAKAVLWGLRQLRSKEDLMKLRSISKEKES